MSTVRFLLDEDVHPLFGRELARREPSLVVRRVGDAGAPPTGTLDPEILSWCETHSFLLVTNNRSSMPAHLADHIAAGRHGAGVLVLNPDMSIGQTIETLLVIWGASEIEEYQDQLIHLPMRPSRIA